MDPFSQNVDESVLQNMGDLSGVISGTQYQAGSPEALPQGTNLSGVGDPNAPADIAQYVGNTAQPGQVVGNAGVVTQPLVAPQPVQPVHDAGAAERQRLQQIAYQAQMQRIQADEEKFQMSIAHLDDETKEREVLRRELEQQREVNNWLNQKVSTQTQIMTNTQRQQQAIQQEASKKQWGILIGHRYHLPYENEAVRRALLAAEDPAHMERIAQNLVQVMNQGTRVASQNTVNSGILAAGSGGQVPATPTGPKPRSGDIAGLISSRGSTVVNWG